MAQFQQEKSENYFPSFSPEVVKEKIRPEAKGREDGNQNRPESERSQISQTEEDIIAFFENGLRDSAASVESGLRKQREFRTKVDPEPHFTELRNLPNKLRAELQKQKVRHAPELEDYREKEKSAKKRLENFKNENGLQRASRQKENKLTFWITILSVGIIETILNSSFFAMDSDLGYLGGFIQAIVISFINIASAIICGLFGAPYLSHIHFGKKILGGLAVVLWLVAIFLFNLLAGHYRAMLEKDHIHAVTLAVDSFSQSPLGIDSVPGWLLFVVGILISVIAFLKVFFSEDKYPGYSKESDHYERQKQRWIAAKQDFIDVLNAKYQRIEEEYRSQLEEARKTPIQYHRSLAASDSYVSGFQTYKDKMANWCSEILAIYRAANRAVRDTPPPSYFEEKSIPDFSNIIVDTQLLEADRPRESEIKNQVKQFEGSEAPEIYAQLEQIYSETLETLQSFFGESFPQTTPAPEGQGTRRRDQGEPATVPQGETP